MKQLFLAFLVVLSSFLAIAGNSEKAEELSFDDNLKVPVVPDKSRDIVKNYMRKEAESLVKLGYKVETMRKGEIVIVTIPTDPLFQPNGSELVVNSANKLLKPLAAYMRTQGRYKILMAVHTDDTGSENYTRSLAESRVQAVYGYFDKIARYPAALIGYPMGQSRPEVANDTRAGRAQNRRIEMYLVPDMELIRTLAKRSR